ncbi:MAG: hypothetical protein GY756_08690 [bacterium]|nr:hypothetical protein [bacterium]
MICTNGDSAGFSCNAVGGGVDGSLTGCYSGGINSNEGCTTGTDASQTDCSTGGDEALI